MLARLSVGGIDLESLLELGRRVVELALRCPGAPQQVVHGRIVGSQHRGLLGMTHRLVDVAGGIRKRPST